MYYFNSFNTKLLILTSAIILHSSLVSTYGMLPKAIRVMTLSWNPANSFVPISWYWLGWRFFFCNEASLFWTKVSCSLEGIQVSHKTWKHLTSQHSPNSHSPNRHYMNWTHIFFFNFLSSFFPPPASLCYWANCSATKAISMSIFNYEQ